MALEPEQEAIRSQIEKSWSDEERESRRNGSSVEDLIQHFAALDRLCDYMVRQNRAKSRRRYARLKNQQ
jgi:hypothetical protein